MLLGMLDWRTHAYVPNAVTSRFAAFNIADATVIAPIHRAGESQQTCGQVA
jgi:hypothetical protein